MLWSNGGEFNWMQSNVSTRPSATTYGTSVTTGANNAWGTGASLMTTSYESYFCRVHINGTTTSALSTQYLIAIGYGSSTYSSATILIPNLMAYGAGPLAQGGIVYTFPLFIPAGVTLYAFGQNSSAATATQYVFMQIYGAPSKMSAVHCGSYVDSFGVSTSTSTGTAITPGTTNVGSWTQMGSNTTKDYWYFQTGFAITGDTNVATNTYFLNLGAGDGTNKRTIITQDHFCITSSAETLTKMPRCCVESTGYVKSGAGLYLNAWNSGTNETAYAAGVYALGGG